MLTSQGIANIAVYFFNCHLANVKQLVQVKLYLLFGAMFCICTLSLSFQGFCQLGISGSTTVMKGTSYGYNGTYNGASSYAFNGSYTYTISGGVVTGTSNTSKSGTAMPSIGAASVSVTWSASGTLSLSCSLGSKSISITAINPLTAGTLSPSSQSINYGLTAAITGTAASGGAVSPVYTYQWMSSPDNVNWTNISGASSLNYTSGQLFSTTYFRRKVTETSTSQIAYTSSVTVIVYPQLTCSINPVSQVIDIGASPTTLTSSITGGTGTYSYQWQTSLDNSAWTNAATSASYNPGSLTQTKYFRLIVTSNGATAISNTALITIRRALGNAIADLIKTDTIPLAKDSLRTTQYSADASSLDHSIQNVLALKVVEETPKYIPGDFSATAVCKVEYAHSATPPYNTIDSIKLSVSYTKDGLTKYNGLNYFTFSNAEFVKITVIRIDAPTTVGGTSFDTRQVLVLTNSLAAKRVFQMADNKWPSLNTPSFMGDALNVSWTFPANTYNNSTQLEWTWLENDMSSSYRSGAVLDTALLFKVNSTRVDLSFTSSSYAIPLLYGGVGKLFVRVRGANVMPSGSRSDGPWSSVQAYSFSGHSDSPNWQATTTYAEEGKRKSVIQYSDGSLRTRQTVTKDNSTNTTVVAETLYDGQGRVAVQILPAPGINNIIAYNKNLNKFNSQPDNSSALDYFDFNTSALGKYTTYPMDTTSGTNLYYSGGNPEKNSTTYNQNIPTANGFAYSVTRYTPDATGRVMMQSGLGDSMRTGYGHTTNYFYGTPAQEELDGLFGTEVGNYTHYFKNMVQDPNGQMSVSYVDMHGRTVATAVAGQSPLALQALNISDTSLYKNQAGKILTRNLLDSASNFLKGKSIESVNTILVPYATLYSFNYNLRKQWLSLPTCSGGTIIDTCQFDLQIAISDESDSTVATYNYSGIDTINFQTAIVLPVGSYRVRKTLAINPDSAESFLRRYDTAGIGICRSVQQLTDSIASLDSTVSGCNIVAIPLTSTSCQASLGTYAGYLSNYAISFGYASSSQLSALQVSDIRNQYVSDSLNCVALNTNTSHTVENIRRQMLLDMVPATGQYAKTSGSGTMYNKYSIFSSTGGFTYTQPFYKYSKKESGATDYYYTGFGIIDSSVLPAKVASMPPGDYQQGFATSWASSLLFYHPEFKRLQLAETSLSSSFDFIDSVNQNVNVAFTPITSDPFFTSISTTVDKNAIKKFSDTAWQSNYSMWQLAYGDALGCKLYADSTNRKTCYSNMPKVFTSTGASVNTGFGLMAITAPIQLQAWNVYKGMYSSVRTDMVNRWLCLHADTSNNFHANTRDNPNLIAQGYKIYFPISNSEKAQNLGWSSWYPNTSGVYPTVSLKDSVKLYGSHCDAYMSAWRLALIDCPTLISKVPDSSQREQVIAKITGRMDSVCKYGSDGANPYGSSTVAPAYSGNTFTSFEQVVQSVLDTLGGGIPRSDVYCNPYVIEYPKPYGKNSVLVKQLTSGLDTCTCSRYSALLAEIIAGGGNTGSLMQINQYLSAHYQDTLSAVLYQGLQQCGSYYYLYNCRPDSSICYDHGMPYTCYYTRCDTLRTIPLASPQPLPVFLQCGFNDSTYTCLTCASFQSFDSAFYGIFGRHPVFSGTLGDSDIIYNNLFARYVNFKTGLQHTWQFYADTLSHTGCPMGGITGVQTPLSVCLSPQALNDTTGLTAPVSPCQQVRNRAAIKAMSIYDAVEQQLITNFNTLYQAQCLAAAESFKVADTLKEYHFTLYYYDQAGNLVKTIPPKGVNPVYRQSWIDSVETAKKNGQQLVPAHTYWTRYCYNSLNQVNIQKTPDAGVSKYYYDRLGRLSTSQNARQSVSGNVYSYTFYDSLGRTTQVGELSGTTPMSDGTSKSDSTLQLWFAANATRRRQITQTVYDTAYTQMTGLVLSQQNLRNRVSYTQVIDTAADASPANAVYYSYDIHGNVDTLVRDFGNSTGKPNAMNQSGNRFKKVVYNYDLISGKVNQVSYQPGQGDAYYQRYLYDAENRLTDVYTARDSVMLLIFPEREAHYDYYKHGPLAQTTFGQLLVQKQDYAYTLQGWLKAINPVLGGTLVNGTNTSEALPIAQDIYGFSLHYYKNDYQPITFPASSTTVMGKLNAAGLFNGNIADMGLTLIGFSTSRVYGYQYDQLNRLVAADVFTPFNPVTGTVSATPSAQHRERISYDANGNILGYLKNGSGSVVMDSLGYCYYQGTNRLQQVTDNVPAANFSSDIDNQAANNYSYDAIGNLSGDASESISSIGWNVYGKITSIIKGGSAVRYTYDPSGNRISKQSSLDTTMYVRDASGNVLSVYTRSSGGSIAQTEVHLYGSSRLGFTRRHAAPDSAVVLSGGFASGTKRIFTRGEKIFELGNHLGNVLVTVTDRRMQMDANSDGTIDSYIADNTSVTDYYSFGMQMPGRTFNLDATVSPYRYGFNDKENDSEVKGIGNQQDYGMRIYDPRLGRFLSLDPISSDYPFYTPYQFAGNKPIVAADLDGLEEFMKIQEDMAKRRAQLQVATINQPRQVTVSPYNPNDKTLAQKWRDSKNFFASATYAAANGLYTLPQQLTADIRQDDYITNIGGNVHEARGIFGEKQRVTNFVNGSTLFIPGASEGQAVKGLAFADDLMRLGVSSFDDAAKVGGNLVKIGLVEDNVMTFSAKIEDQVVEGISNFVVKDKKLLLNDLHLQGSSSGKIGRQALWDMAKDLGKQYNVQEVIIQGGKRTTGKYKGKTPSPITIKVE